MEYKNSVKGKAKLGVQTFAEALLVIPKTLAENSGYDVQDTILNLVDEYIQKKIPVGLNCEQEGTISPEMSGILDNFCVKR
jgi:T-complex protein 1 subunit zeta